MSIYIIEGVDGTGKTTLAKEIARQKNAAILHCSFNKKWDMKEYHSAMILAAEDMNDSGINVVLDRWSPSEKVYGSVFRNGESYKTSELIKYYYIVLKLEIIFIYCRNDNAVENHFKNLEKRKEMFKDISDLVSEFDGYVKDHSWMNWLTYDFDKVSMIGFVKDLP